MISVVIPVRNRAHLVTKTLESVAGQTLLPRRVILVDNGSTDATAEVLGQWAAAQSSDVITLSEPIPGAARARNRGLKEVETPYVMFFDSDDIMPPTHIEDVTSGLREHDWPLLGAFDAEIHSLDGKILPRPYRGGDYIANQVFHSCISTQRCVINTELARSVGGWDDELGGWDDLEFGTRLVVSAEPVYLPLREPVKIMAQAESITGTDFSSKAGQWERALDACERDLAELPRYKRLVDYRRAILAGYYMREGHAELATPLLRSFKMRMLARYVACGGRGVGQIAGLLG